jgi:hypothetical protein
MSESFPDGMDRGESVNPPRRGQGVWARRGFVSLFLTFLVFALFNAFGQAASTSQASSSAALLRVSAPATVRGGLVYQVSIEVTARRSLANPQLVLSSGWFSGLTTNAEVPQPGTQSSDDGDTIFRLGAMGPGQVRHLRIYFQVNPTTIAWQRPQDLTLQDGGASLVAVHRSLTAYP